MIFFYIVKYKTTIFVFLFLCLFNIQCTNIHNINIKNHIDSFTFDGSKYSYISWTSSDDFYLNNSIRNIIHTITRDISEKNSNFNRLKVDGILIIKCSENKKIFYTFTPKNNNINYRGTITNNIEYELEAGREGTIEFRYEFNPTLHPPLPKPGQKVNGSHAHARTA